MCWLMQIFQVNAHTLALFVSNTIPLKYLIIQREFKAL